MATLWRGSSATRVLAMLLTIGTTALSGGTAQAAPQYSNDCNYCHRMPPLDAAAQDKDADSGAVPGNHQGHASANVFSCAKCHGVQTLFYLTSHRDGMIELNDELGYSRKSAGVFLNQTSAPPSPLGSCATASCHSDGKGHGKLTPAWASAPFVAPGDCSRCHDVAPATGSHPVSGSKHARYFGTGTGSCLKCHADHLAQGLPFSHATSAGGRPIEVKFSGGGSFAGSVCSGLYCHSNGKGSFASPSWGATLDCTGCHGSATSPGPAALSGKHANHVNNAAFLGVNYGCAECHGATVSDNSTISDLTKHVDGSVEFAGPRLGSVSAGSCASAYCHSDGRGTQKPVSWTQSGSLDCKGCHGSDSAPAFTSLAGEPNYPSVGLTRANSHKAHVSGATDCASCHAGTVDGTGKLAGSGHINGSIDVSFNGSVAGPGATWNAGTAGCSAIVCHSDGTSVATGTLAGGNPVWGGSSLACDACHGFPPAYPNGTPKANTHYAHNFGCNTCHAGTTADGSTISSSLHANHVYDVSPGAGVSFSYVFAPSGGTCSSISCHNGGTAVWGSTLTCGACHVTSPGGD